MWTSAQSRGVGFLGCRPPRHLGRGPCARDKCPHLVYKKRKQNIPTWTFVSDKKVNPFYKIRTLPFAILGPSPEKVILLVNN